MQLFFTLFLDFQAFSKRHRTVAVRTPERVSRARSYIQEEDIRSWFSELTDNVTALNALDIFEDSNRVFNLDETNIQLCPSTGKVISIRGTKNVYEVAPGPCKSNLTFVGTFNASGAIVAPVTIYILIYDYHGTL